MTLQDRLTELRKLNGLTQPDLAKKSNVPLRSLQNYEYGARNPKVMIHLCRIADFFGISLDYLLGRTDDPTRH